MNRKIYSLLLIAAVFFIESCATKDDGPEPDVSAPTIPLNLTVTEVTTTSIAISWSASSDDVEVTGYNIYINDQIVNNTDQTSFVLSDLTPQTSYNLGVSAYDAAQNNSEISYLQVTTEAAKELAGNAEFFSSNTGLDGYIMVDDARHDRVFLMNSAAEIVYEWEIGRASCRERV